MVTATATVRVEFTYRHLTFNQILTRRCGFLEGTSRRDVVGCDHVTQNGQNFGVFDVCDHAWLWRHALKVRRVLNVGRLRWPVVGLGVGGFDGLPLFVALEDVGIFFLEGFAGHGLLDQISDFLGRWPDVFQVDVIAGLRSSGYPTGPTCRSGHNR